MKDIPVFTGTHGIATLVLRQITWSGRAYVLVRSVWDDAAAFLQECRGFCIACGAEEVYASQECEDLPAAHAYDMIHMYRPKAELPAPRQVVTPEPLTRENGGAFLEVFNERFRAVDNAVAYEEKDIKRLLDTDCAFLVRQNGQYAAVAEISKTGLEAIAVMPEYRGLGYDLALTVLPMIPNTTITLKVATSNSRALALYDRLGFTRGQTLSRWWKL